MMLRHRSVELDPYARGLAFGKAHSAGVENTVTSYERLFLARNGIDPRELRDTGARIAARMAATAPHELAEIGGIAEGAGVPVPALVAINARTELLAGRPECSVIGIEPRGAARGTILAQNWDWHPDLAPSLTCWTVEHEAGWFTTVTEAGILGKIGLNDAGVAVCLNILHSSADGGEPDGMPVHLALRRLLHRARSVGHARQLLEESHFTASTAITVADLSDVETIEISPAGVRPIETDDGVTTHTNHFLGSIDGASDIALTEWPDTVARLADLRRRTGAQGGAHDPEAVKRTLRSHEGAPISVCCHDAGNPTYPDRQATLASVVLHPAERRIEVAPGNPCVTPYADEGENAP